MLNNGADVAAVVRHFQNTEATYHRWRNQYGGTKADDAKTFKGAGELGPPLNNYHFSCCIRAGREGRNRVF